VLVTKFVEIVTIMFSTKSMDRITYMDGMFCFI
jgi:hypothetical protein